VAWTVLASVLACVFCGSSFRTKMLGSAWLTCFLMALIRQNVIWIYICNINVYLHCLVLTYLHITFIILIVHVYYISLICIITNSLSVTPVSSTNKTDHHVITDMLLKVALNTINLANLQMSWVID
jgi:hypothetical protein